MLFRTINFGKGQGSQDILLRGASGHQYYSAFRAYPLTDEEWSKLKSDTVMRHLEDGGEGKGSKNQKKSRSRKIFGLEKCTEAAAKSFNRQLLEDLPCSVSSGKDNRNIFDDKSAPSQSLRHADIEVLKDSGLGAKDIVGTILANSTSFAQKTEYSQEKYLKKKENKYGDVLLFLPVDILSLSDFLFKRDAAKVLGMRYDTLSQILSYANVRAKGRFLVYENAGGIVIAAMLHRMGGLGELLHCHAGTNPQHQAVSFMNFTEQELRPLRNLDVFYLIPGRGLKTKAKESNEDEEFGTIQLKLENSPEEIELSSEPLPKKRRKDEPVPIDSEAVTEQEEASVSNADKPKSKTCREENEKSMELLKFPFDSLVIAAKEHPLSILQRLLPHISLSCPFVIYCAYAEVRFFFTIFSKYFECSLGYNSQRFKMILF